MRCPLLLCVLALGSAPACGGAGAHPTAAPAHAAAADPLRATIVREDRRMADAYNAHDADRLMAVFAPDLEFIHDTGGVLDHAQVATGFRRVFANNPDIRRDLVGELEIYPVKDFGAIEIGAHRFCHTERGKLDCGTFRFVQVWREAAGAWQIARVVSYGH